MEGDKIKLNRVEQHQINRSNPIWKIIDDYCFRSKNLYNFANYIIRQEFIFNKKWIRSRELDKMIQNSEPYKLLGSQASQRLLDLLDKNWKSFFIAIKDWTNNPDKYLGRPKLPKYMKKDGRNILTVKNIQFSIQNNYIKFSWKPLKQLNGTFKTKIKDKPLQIRFIPKGLVYIMELVYEITVTEIKPIVNNIVGIDLGLENFATIVNNMGLQPIVIKGGVLKSINQFYNKETSKYRSILEKINKTQTSQRLHKLSLRRNNKIKEYMHKSSKYILDYCKNNKIDTIIIGHNVGWKQNINIGKQNNQNFVAIPFNMFIKQIQYKAENCGIKVIILEESYTSKASFLDGDIICTSNKDNINKTFSGKRIKRGLYKSKNNIIINADVNGGYNILKKAIPNAFVDGIEGVGLHPVVVRL